MSRKPFSAIGLNPNLHPHYSDHLAVICIIMGIPLLLTDEEYSKKIKIQYPDLKTLIEDWENVQIESFVRNYDILFQSEMWPRKKMIEMLTPFEKKYQKHLRNVHCPHGFSDKGFWLEKCVDEDITLLYGENMIDLLKARGVWHKIGPYIRTGNYRYTYYKKKKTYYETLVQKQILSQFANPSLPLLLYAPTWQDPESSSSFREAAPILLKQLPREEFNLLIKLHPRIEENDPIDLDRVTFPYREHPQIAFADEWTVIYPLLDMADAYIGDMSSIGYDFLAFNRPMIFLNQNERDLQTDRATYLFQCGVAINPNEYFRLYSIIDQVLHKENQAATELRQHIYEYTFGEEIPFETLRNNIWEACKQPRLLPK